MAEDNLYDVLWDFCSGFRSTRTVDVSNGTYVAKRLLSLKMPDDYEPEAKRAVFSHTLSRHLFLIHWREIAEQGLKAQSNGSRAFALGQVLSKINRDHLRLVALDLAYGDDWRKNFTDKEAKTARRACETINSGAREQKLPPE